MWSRCVVDHIKSPPARKLRWAKAEREGFEPPDLLQSTVFKTAAFDRSAISPAQKYTLKGVFKKKFGFCMNL